eukprot:1052397-Ditylum_brightwellii.AAC.1
MPLGPAAFPLAIRWRAAQTSRREIGMARQVKSSSWSIKSSTVRLQVKGDWLLNNLLKCSAKTCAFSSSVLAFLPSSIVMRMV